MTRPNTPSSRRCVWFVTITLGVPAWTGTPMLAQDEPMFMTFGTLPGGNHNVGAADISPEGTAVVGAGTHAGFADFEAFRWTEQTGFVGLGTLGTGGISKAAAVSRHGDTVGGWAHNERFEPEAFRWTEAEGMVGLGDLPGGEFNSRAHDISQDGRVVVGNSFTSGLGAFRWTSEEGMIDLGDLPGGCEYSSAIGISNDGSVIVGISDSDVGTQVFRWTAAEGMVGLAIPDGWIDMSATGVSGDSRVIVGAGAVIDDDGQYRIEAFRWSPARGFEGLGDLPGGRFQSEALATNADGSVIVGASITGNRNTAFIWTRRHGLRNLEDIIVNDLGLDVGDLLLVGANAVSADGRWIIGGAWGGDDGSQSWLVYLGPDCPADYDGDFDADTDDFFLYLDLFIAGDRRADIDDDADNDSDDFYAFLEDFTTPCP